MTKPHKFEPGERRAVNPTIYDGRFCRHCGEDAAGHPPNPPEAEEPPQGIFSVIVSTAPKTPTHKLALSFSAAPNPTNDTPVPNVIERLQWSHEGAPEERGRALVALGYKQTSRKFRTVARLPPGKTGIEALRDVAPEEYERILENLERMAADHYRRYCAKDSGNGDQLELSQEDFDAFKKAGGESS